MSAIGSLSYCLYKKFPLRKRVHLYKIKEYPHIFGGITMFGLGSQEIILVLVVVLVVFGAAKLPQIGKGMGEAIKNFKKSVKETEDATDITPMVTKTEETVKDNVKQEEKSKQG